jgi:hypothetical protein
MRAQNVCNGVQKQTSIDGYPQQKLHTQTMKVPALRIEVNGELIALAGAEGLDILSGQVAFGASQTGGIEVSRVALGVMGLAVHGPNPRQLTWGTGIKLGLGDRVTFEITEVEQPSPPDETLGTPTSSELAAVAAAERKQARKKWYETAWSALVVSGRYNTSAIGQERTLNVRRLR